MLPQISLETAHTFVGYGPSYNAEVSRFIGADWRAILKRVINSNVYIKPTSTTYQLADGRVLHIVHRIADDYLRLYRNYREWSVWNGAYWDTMPDPETGRDRNPLLMAQTILDILEQRRLDGEANGHEVATAQALLKQKQQQFEQAEVLRQDMKHKRADWAGNRLVGG